MTSRRNPLTIAVYTALSLLVLVLVAIPLMLSLGGCNDPGHERRGDTTPPSGASDRPSNPSSPGGADRR